MTKTLSTVSENKIAVWAITPSGAALAARIASSLPKADVYVAGHPGIVTDSAVRVASLADAVAEHFHRYAGHVFIMAAGIVVRTVASLMIHKTQDPAVVVVDDAGNFAVSLLSGHIGGANRLADQVAGAIDAQAVITTATDANQAPAIDVLAVELGLQIENPSVIKDVNMALLTGAPVEVHDPLGILAGRIPNAAAFDGSGAASPARVCVDDRIAAAPPGALVLRPSSLVAGIGCNRNTSAEEIRELVLNTLQASGLARASLKGLASIDIKADEPGLAALAEELGLPLEFFGRDEIGGVEDTVPTPSAAVAQHVGVKSVCEAAAILGSRGGALIVPKQTSTNATVAIARIKACRRTGGLEFSGSGGKGLPYPGASNVEHATRRPTPGGHGTNQLYIVGIGPGRLEHLSQRATEVLRSVECVAGYSMYLDLIQPLTGGKKILRSGMMKEVQRVEAAIELAMSGKTCALVSSGDPGIYAMAGLVFETCKIKNIPVRPPGGMADAAAGVSVLTVEVIPGIPALCAGAALLGAPLAHDFAVVSLSDLLTPWEVIAERLEAAARADFVIVLYNPKSQKRDWQLSKAQEIILAHRDPQTPVGVVAAAMRPDQEVQVIALRDLHRARVDMQTTVFIGSRSSSRYLDFMFTPRGYSGKYDLA